MAAVEVTISGVLFDKLNRTTQNVVLIGEATLTGVGVGGGPIIPPDKPPPEKPPGIWGGGNEPFPTPPIFFPPAVPPALKPPQPPAPVAPTTAVPGHWATQPIAPPEYIIVNYPGIGPVVVAPPAEAQPKA